MAFLFRKILLHPVAYFYLLGVFLFFFYHRQFHAGTPIFLLFFLFFYATSAKIFFNLFLDQTFRELRKFSFLERVEKSSRKKGVRKKKPLDYEFVKNKLRHIFLTNSTLFLLLPAMGILGLPFLHLGWVYEILGLIVLIILFLYFSIKKVNQFFQIQSNLLAWTALKYILLLQVVSFSFWVFLLILL